MEDVLPSLMEQGITVLLVTKHCDAPGIESFSDKVEGAPDCPLPESLRSHITLKSPAVYIYTSGTTGKSAAAQTAVLIPWFVLPVTCFITGLPKAAVINQNRLLTVLAVSSSNGVTADDVIYLNLPLYHTAGFFIGFIGSIETGEMMLNCRWSNRDVWVFFWCFSPTFFSHLILNSTIKTRKKKEVLRVVESQPNPHPSLHCIKPAITSSAGLAMEEEQKETQ